MLNTLQKKDLNLEIIYQMQKLLLNKIRQASQHLQTHGYAVIPDFISRQTCLTAIDQINRLIDNWQPTPQSNYIFNVSTYHKQTKANKYFLDSASNISFFYEPNAFKDGKVTVSKRHSINKIGHALHQLNPVFKDITYTPGVWEICKQNNIMDPVVVQSMANLKQPKVGGKYRIHQDSTYMYCQPDTLLGFWIPFDNATLENGCLWGLPGSHKGKLYTRHQVIDGQMHDEVFYQDNYKQSDFIPIQMSAGSLIAFKGKFLHKSHENLSDLSRYAYAWHLIDKNSKFSPDNWLKRASFPEFIKNEIQ